MTGDEFVAAVKNAAVALTSLSGAIYACGYLVVRARARALGADPGFALVDQAYIFAGFRFLLVLFISLLICMPALLLLRWLGRQAGRLGTDWLFVLEAGGVALAAAATVAAYVATTSVSGVLLSGSRDWLAGAALGRNGFGALLGLATTAGAAAALLWTRGYFARAGAVDPLGAALALNTGLLIALLPVQHGVFHADRTARRLEAAPHSVTGLVSPVWTVDRAADRVTLFGRGPDGQARLVTVKADQLDGVPVVAVGTIGDVLEGSGK